MSVLPPEAPGPNPGQPGHYAHTNWLTASVKALDSAQAGEPEAGLDAPLTAGNWGSGFVKLHRRGYAVQVNVSLAAAVALSAGAGICTMPSGFRPAGPDVWFVTLMNGTSEVPVRCHLDPTTGLFNTQKALAFDNLLRGSFSYPIATRS